MKPKTTAKIKMFGRKAWEFVKTYGPWAVVGFGASYAATGVVKAHNDHKAVKQLRAEMDNLTEIVSHNARCGNATNDRVSTLERQTNELLEKALRQTEGEAV